MADDVSTLESLKDVATAAEKELTKARGAKYIGDEGKARETVKGLASALNSLWLQPTNKTYPPKITAYLNVLKSIQANAKKPDYKGRLTDAEDLKAVAIAIAAAEKALKIVAPGGMKTGADVAADADMLQKEIIPNDQPLGRLRGLASSLKGAAESGNPIALERVTADLTEARSKFDIGTPGFDIADALLSLTQPAPEAPGWMDKRLWDQERIDAQSELTTAIDAAKRIGRMRGVTPELRALLAQAVVRMWRVARNPADDDAKKILIPESVAKLEEKSAEMKGHDARGPIEDLIDSLNKVAGIEDNGAGSWAESKTIATMPREPMALFPHEPLTEADIRRLRVKGPEHAAAELARRAQAAGLTRSDATQVITGTLIGLFPELVRSGRARRQRGPIALADGGPVKPGERYIVGELGPEILTVTAPGTVTKAPMTELPGPHPEAGPVGPPRPFVEMKSPYTTERYISPEPLTEPSPESIAERIGGVIIRAEMPVQRPMTEPHIVYPPMVPMMAPTAEDIQRARGIPPPPPRPIEVQEFEATIEGYAPQVVGEQPPPPFLGVPEPGAAGTYTPPPEDESFGAPPLPPPEDLLPPGPRRPWAEAARRWLETWRKVTVQGGIQPGESEVEFERRIHPPTPELPVGACPPMYPHKSPLL